MDATSSPPTVEPAVHPRRPSRSLLTRALDLAAIVVVALALYKIFIAPRIFASRPVPAPAMALPMLDGGRFDVQGHRGSVVFLDFFASWCDPCKLELPLVEQYAAAHPQAQIYAIDVGERPEFVRAFAQAKRLRNVVLDPDQAAAGAFGVTGFPTMVVIDPHGLIRARWEGFNPAIESAMGNAQATLGSPAQPPA